MRTVLIVDDDDIIREVAKVALEVVGGWQVLAATSGPEATALAAQRQPDAVLLDVMMPDMDGPSVASALGRESATAAIPIIFLTAKGADLDTMTVSEPNVAGVIDKPFDPMTLAGDISGMLGWQS